MVHLVTEAPSFIMDYIMKIEIGPYVNWIGPYQIAEKILFWIPKYDDNHLEYSKGYDKYVYPLGEFLSGKEKHSLLTKLCNWIHSKQERKVKIHIDPYDTWNMDHTLALIILPMLKQLQEKRHGSPMVNSEDVPENLQASTHQHYDDQKCFDWYIDAPVDDLVHVRWEWVMNEMIWTFEQLVDKDNDLKFFEKGFDSVEYTQHHARIDNGLRLFGKYYQGLWD
jgi:hypothetical protein